MSEISIVIPTLGRAGALRDVLDGLSRAKVTPASDFEVVIALDAQADPDGVGDLEPGGIASAVVQASVTGASGARNAGWRSTSSPLILFLDDDIVPGSDLIAQHLAWHERHPEREVGVLGHVRWSRHVKVTPFMRWLETGIQFDYGTIRSVEVEWQRFYSANVSVKREMLELVGGFDEERFPYGYEDLELARRMSEHGFRLLYNRDAVAEHMKTESLEGWRRNLRRIAQAERLMTTLYPDQPAYFYNRFRAAAELPRSHGRFARLVRFVRPGTPWLGPRVWRSYDFVCTQRLAPEFLAEWETAALAGRTD